MAPTNRCRVSHDEEQSPIALAWPTAADETHRTQIVARENAYHLQHLPRRALFFIVAI